MKRARAAAPTGKPLALDSEFGQCEQDEYRQGDGGLEVRCILHFTFGTRVL